MPFTNLRTTSNASGKQRVLSLLTSFLYLSSSLSTVNAQVTLYNNPGQSALGTAGGTASSTAAEAEYTGLGAYDPLVLVPPPVPQPPPPREFPIVLRTEGQPGLSIPLQGNVLGFSIEMSVVDQVSEWCCFSSGRERCLIVFSVGRNS